MTSATENELVKAAEEKGAKRVSLDVLEGNIKKADYYIHPQSQLTICIITLQNGFTVTGESACADPKNFDEEIGRRIAFDNAKKKIWPLMGYHLKQELFLNPEETNFQDRVRTEQRQLSDKVKKLHAFINGNVQFERLDKEDKLDLKAQYSIMKDYLRILNKRIDRF